MCQGPMEVILSHKWTLFRLNRALSLKATCFDRERSTSGALLQNLENQDKIVALR